MSEEQAGADEGGDEEKAEDASAAPAAVPAADDVGADQAASPPDDAGVLGGGATTAAPETQNADAATNEAAPDEGGAAEGEKTAPESSPGDAEQAPLPNAEDPNGAPAPEGDGEGNATPGAALGTAAAAKDESNDPKNDDADVDKHKPREKVIVSAETQAAIDEAKKRMYQVDDEFIDNVLQGQFEKAVEMMGPLSTLDQDADQEIARLTNVYENAVDNVFNANVSNTSGNDFAEHVLGAQIQQLFQIGTSSGEEDENARRHKEVDDGFGFKPNKPKPEFSSDEDENVEKEPEVNKSLNWKKDYDLDAKNNTEILGSKFAIEQEEAEKAAKKEEMKRMAQWQAEMEQADAEPEFDQYGRLKKKTRRKLEGVQGINETPWHDRSFVDPRNQLPVRMKAREINRAFAAVALLTNHAQTELIGVGTLVYCPCDPDNVYVLSSAHTIINDRQAKKIKCIVKLRGGPSSLQTAGRYNFEFNCIGETFMVDRMTNLSLTRVSDYCVNASEREFSVSVPASNFAVPLEPFDFYFPNAVPPPDSEEARKQFEKTGLPAAYFNPPPRDPKQVCAKLFAENLLMLDVRWDPDRVTRTVEDKNFDKNMSEEQQALASMLDDGTGTSAPAKVTLNISSPVIASASPASSVENGAAGGNGTTAGGNGEEKQTQHFIEEELTPEELADYILSETIPDETVEDPADLEEEEEENKGDGGSEKSGDLIADLLKSGAEEEKGAEEEEEKGIKESVIPWSRQRLKKFYDSPDSSHLVCRDLGRLQAYTTDSVRYTMRAYNRKFSGQPIFYMRLAEYVPPKPKENREATENSSESSRNKHDEQFKVVLTPVLCGVHLNNNDEGRSALLSLYKSINLVLLNESDEDEDQTSSKAGSKDDGAGSKTSGPEEDDDEKQERKRRRQEKEQEELAKLSPYGAKSNAAIRLLTDHIPKVKEHYQKAALQTVLKCDFVTFRQHAACLRVDLINHQYPEYNNRTLLHLIATAAEPTSLQVDTAIEITQLLVKSHGDVSIQDRNGWNPLMAHVAASSGETVTLLSIRLQYEDGDEFREEVLQQETKQGWNVYEIGILHNAEEELMDYLKEKWPHIVRPEKLALCYGAKRKFGR
ncbi:unnamed protein product [Amoebophrya sp. A120]|nr:unnamed protein product [Amoebophrya sp. A120]|eukprot:GSA120T00010715001.1